MKSTSRRRSYPTGSIVDMMGVISQLILWMAGHFQFDEHRVDIFDDAQQFQLLTQEDLLEIHVVREIDVAECQLSFVIINVGHGQGELDVLRFITIQSIVVIGIACGRI